MNQLIPSPDTLPVSWGWFKFLLMLIFPLHLLFMNAMLGATAIALLARFKKDETALRLAHSLARAIPFLTAFAVNLGVAALLFIQVLYGQFFYTSSVLMALFWLAVIPLLMTAYYLLYLYDFRFKTLGAAGGVIPGLVFVIFLVIAFIYTNNMTLMLKPQAWSAYFGNASGTILHLNDPALWPRYLHFIIGGTAIGGLFVALLGKFREKTDAALAEAAISIGMKTFAYLTMAQIMAGFLFMILLPRPVMQMFMGGDPIATTLFVVGLLLASAVAATGMKGMVYLSTGLAVPLVYVMSFMRDFVRTGYLQPFFSPASLVVAFTQYAPMLIFLAALILGVIIICWMVNKAIMAGADRE